MATNEITGRAATEPMESASFERLAGACAILAGVAGLLYLAAFLVTKVGLLTFGCAGLSLFGLSCRLTRSPHFPRALGYLGYVLAALLVIIYLARLIILSPSNPAVLLPAALAGFIVNPAWYVWLGLVLWK